ncbi:hypothetical protein NNO_2171 [Hydrogenimonas sp.]|nr:hypothetical protein NNO_2171 [Hydrogenimonas sp.]
MPIFHYRTDPQAQKPMLHSKSNIAEICDFMAQGGLGEHLTSLKG